MTERVLIMRHASGLVNRARRVAIEKWPDARLEVHDLSAYGKPPADFRWDRYVHVLIDDEYLRREGLLWISELRGKPRFPAIVRVPGEARKHRPPSEIDVKAPPLPARREARTDHAADVKPIPKFDRSRAEKSLAGGAGEHTSTAAATAAAVTANASTAQRYEARRLADADAVLKSAGIQGFTPVKALGSGATANVCLCERMSDKQQVVLKILKGEGSGDSDLLSRFVQEYFATSSIDSPYVAKVFEHGFTDSHAYIVMEY